MSRPAFVPPADWPTNVEVACVAICRALGECRCRAEGSLLDAPPVTGRPCLQEGAHLVEARAVTEALTAHHRLRSPTIERVA